MMPHQMPVYHYQKLRAPGNNNAQLLKSLGKDHWGVFTGLFGLAANEVLVIDAHESADFQGHPQAVERQVWQPTARPTDTTPCNKPGLYVFRRFQVREADADEVVTLSYEAWKTFETSADYATEPQGLFRPPADDDGTVPMMLVTWYDGFDSWERSRNPPAAARENFSRRRDLTLSTCAVATRLVV